MKTIPIVLAASLAAPAAMAQGIDLSKGGPIDITAQSGIEWLQNQHQVVAAGDARAIRQDVTVTADRLIASYRPKAGKGGGAQTTTQASAIAGEDAASGNEIYRLEAQGNVRITTPTDQAQGDRAIYDLDQAVMVMTGRNLRLATPNDVLTARDDLEYWSQKHMAVARGNATVLTKDARRISADTLVAYTNPADNASKPQPASASGGDSLAASGKLEKVEAFGGVSVRTPTDTVTGDRGVYVPETGIALLIGNVRITRGQNQLSGAEAEVNLKTGVSRLLSGTSGRVEGLIVPNDASNKDLATPGGTPKR